MAVEAQVTAALLRQGRGLDRLSGALLLLGVAFGFGQRLLESRDPILTSTCLLVVLFGVLQKYWALRVAFDAELFRGLETHSLAELDAAMLALGLMPGSRSGRPLTERSRGALRLLRRQVACLASQGVLALGAMAYTLLTAFSS